ncbi:glycosyltransferase family 2 protein [uncultured Acetatifactor sp.]|uniref:glycosyltransferase family 2 protein n=1 Tax=uncultured Acetatifactor sp. TaxID=1671927 RepID=UPI0026195CC4|nr:glycosyltransferase family A protein [uncultured Acetatifactor sp.]
MISVIIPVYNAEPYLNRCIDSVLASAYSDFEIILVNDGSTDRSPDICRAYAENDIRVVFLSQENRGVSSARNLGLEAARGEWIVFLDSDDFITDDYLSLTADKAYGQQDLILFRFAKHASSASRPTPGETDSSLPGAADSGLPGAADSGLSGATACADAVHLSPDFATGSDGIVPDRAPNVRDGQGADNFSEKALLYQGGEMLDLISRILVPRPLTESCSPDFRTPCARAYRRSLIERYSIRFSPDIRIGEDLLFNLEYQLRAKSCAYVPKTVYFYDIHGDSSSHHFNPGLRQNHGRLLEAVREALEKNGMFPRLQRDYCSYALENLTYVLIREIFSPLSTRKYRESRRLCREMRRSPLYRQAMRQNLSTGILPRRILVSAFWLRCYLLTALISRVSYAWLERR